MMELNDSSDLIHQQPKRFLEDEETSVGSTGDVLKNTFIVFGSIFAALFLIFLFLRKRYPRVYNVRDSVPELKCALAEDTLGTLRWIYRVFFVPEEDMYDQCGLDAVVFLRMLRFGCHVAFMGMLNSIYLMPIYARSPSTDDGVALGGFEKVTLGNVPEKDNRVFATVVAAYIIFGYTMFLLMKEFQWFAQYRHDFLSKARPDNYSVFVSGIPPEYRSNEALLAYFREVNDEGVLEARVAINIKNLESDVAERTKIVSKLEHAINVLNVKGERPTHKVKKSKCCGKGEKVDSIDEYTKQLEEYNEKISESITALEDEIVEPTKDEVEEDSTYKSKETTDDVEKGVLVTDPESSAVESIEVNPLVAAPETKVDNSSARDNELGDEKKRTSLVASMKSLLSTEDGTPKDAAFVTFSSLRARASAVQMIHHETPFTMVVQEAPLPKDIFWGNVGMTHKKHQLSSLLGKTLTVILCVFWAVPVTFVSSLANVESLKEHIPFLEDWVEAAPWLEGVLAQLAPLLLVVFVALLPVFLMILAKIEGHNSTGRLMAVFFMKLCVFNIIHTFLIVTISGSIFESIQAIADNPSMIVEMLASSIPAQASFFIQYSLVQTFLPMGLEITRIVAIVKAFLRSKIGPNLTKKERNTPFLGLAPLSAPEEFNHAKALSYIILFFLILFVYSVMSPIMAFVQAFVFGLTSMIYRHQFIYIYPKSNDSGGQLWAQAVRLIFLCMFIAQITLFGVLGLKKNPLAVALLVPLVIITGLFFTYLKQQHYIVTDHLPSISAMKKDKENIAKDLDKEFLKGEYKQLALQEKHVTPENVIREDEIREDTYEFNDDYA